MIRTLVGIAVIWSAPVYAQGTIITSPIDGSQTVLAQPDVAANSVKAVDAQGAKLRGLDKVSGEVFDFDLAIGASASIGRIEINLGACRFPEDNPAGEAFAWIEINDPRRTDALFEGWMSASSPALNALDHARYDVWVIRCTTA